VSQVTRVENAGGLEAVKVGGHVFKLDGLGEKRRVILDSNCNL